MIFVPIQRDNVWIMLDIVLWHMHYCLKFLPNSELKKFREVPRRCDTVYINHAESILAPEADRSIIKLAVMHMQKACIYY